jgi:hypothetical protein
LNSRIQTIVFFFDAQVAQNKHRFKRSANCYLEGASDVPAAGKYPGQPKEQQDPARATANEAAPPKGKPAGRPCRRRGGYNHRPHPTWEASDQRRTAKRHSVESGVSCIWCFLGQTPPRETPLPANGTCQPRRLSVVSDLPIKRLTRATPIGQSALAAEQGCFAAPFIPKSSTSGGNSHRKGITRGKHLPRRIDSESRRKVLRSFWVGAGKAAKRGHSSGDRGRLRCSELWRSVPDALKVTRSQAEEFPVRMRIGGRQREFSGGTGPNQDQSS